MHFWPGVSHKRSFGIFRAQGMCLVAANVVGINSTPPNPLRATSWGGMGKRQGKGRKGEEKGPEKTPPPK